MSHFMIVLIPYINLLNLSWIIKCLFLRNMKPLNVSVKHNMYPLITHYENAPIQNILKILQPKKGKFSDKKF